MANMLANDRYQTELRSTWVADPAATTLQVKAIPSNLPTIVTLNWKQDSETKFSVTGTSGDSPSNFALTGVTVLSGGEVNLPENTPVNCVIHEDFFNQYSEVVNDDYIRMNDRVDDPGTPSTGKALFYLKNSAPFSINDDGTIQQIGFRSEQWIDVADGATMDIDLSETVKKLKYRLGPLAGNRTLTISNSAEGQIFLVRVMQDGTGSRIPTWFPVTTDTVTITIANPGVITTTKDLRTGTPVVFTTTDTLPTGITAGTKYYWIRTGATSGNIATSKANAQAGTTITTSSTQAGTHTMTVGIIWAGDEVGEFSTAKFEYDDFVFTVHDLNTITGVKIAGEY